MEILLWHFLYANGSNGNHTTVPTIGKAWFTLAMETEAETETEARNSIQTL